MGGYVIGAASFSDDGRYRYWLTREWDSTRFRVAFVGLNPSTADATRDDPTIRKCIGFAKRWGYGSLVMLNLYGFVATNPRDMLALPHHARVGPQNDEQLFLNMGLCETVVCCWGAHADIDRASAVWYMAGNRANCFGLTRNGQPKHPLYLSYETPCKAWR